jgi:hypothetical protein
MQNFSSFRVGYAKARSPTEMKMPLEEPLTTAQLHFSFVSKQRLHIVTEETLRLVFGYFGEVADVSIKKSIVNPVS